MDEASRAFEPAVQLALVRSPRDIEGDVEARPLGNGEVGIGYVRDRAKIGEHRAVGEVLRSHRARQYHEHQSGHRTTHHHSP